MSSNAYARARREGLKAYGAAISEHKDPYLPVLQDKLTTLNQMDRMSLGILAVPLDRVVGTVTQGRSYAFANNFMPILESSSEFSGKWTALYESVEEEGLRDPAKMLEYMGYYYLIEGNKRISVMKSLGAEYVEGDVTRVIPVKTAESENIAYFEYCAFAKESGLYDLFFSKPGSYARLVDLPGVRAGEAWDDEEIMSLRKIYHYFYTAYHKIMSGRPCQPCGDAFLLWLLAFGYDDVKNNALDDVEKSIRLMQEEFLLHTDTVSIVMDSRTNDPQPSLISSLFRPSRIKAAFLYSRPVNQSAWNYWHDMGRLEVEEKMGDRVETTMAISTSRTENEEVIEKLIKDGHSVIFATSPLMLNSCIEPSLRHPEVKLLVSSQLAGYQHVRTYYLRFYEAKFLLGLAAGILSKNGKIGYIADYPIYGSPSMINAFALGARMVNPEARIYLNWTSLASYDVAEPFHDPEIRVVCNRDLTAPDHASRDSGLYVRGENGEALSMATMIPRWGIFYRHVIEQVQKGTFDAAKSGEASQNYWWGIASDVLSIATSARFDPYCARLIRNAEEQIREQTYTPFEGLLKDQKGVIRCEADRRLTPAEVLTMDYLADNVVGSLPEPEELTPSARPLVVGQGIHSLQKAEVSTISWNQTRN